MALQAELQRIKGGFLPSFWVANGMELFERLAYYGQATILSLFLRDHLKFSEIEAGQLSSVFGGLIYLLPIFAGALADRFGFRKAFSIAFGGLALGYFLIGSFGMAVFRPVYGDGPHYWALFFVLIVTAMSGAFIKPSVLGTVALTSTSATKSLGYAIYYWLVNIGAAIGPAIAFVVRDSIGIAAVYVVSAVSCLLMLVTTRLFYQEPPAKEATEGKSIVRVLSDMMLVLANFRFIFFLLLFGLYWVLFWQFFIVIPYYVSDFIAKDAPVELLISAGAWTIIVLQLPINRLTKHIPTQTAIVIGFVLASAAWLLWYLVLPSAGSQTVGLFGQQWYLGNIIIVVGIVLFSIGEQTQAPRFYEYIADMAPKGQEALFQGYAFLPIAIAWGFGGTFGGWVYTKYATAAKEPATIFLIMFGIGAAATVLMVVYNSYSKKKGA